MCLIITLKTQLFMCREILGSSKSKKLVPFWNMFKSKPSLLIIKENEFVRKTHKFKKKETE